MANDQLPAEVTFAIDFNLHQVPAALGLEVPPGAAAQMLGITKEQLLAYNADIEREVVSAAKDLLTNADLAQAVDQLPVPAGGTMVTLGDSITTYRYGYSALLEAMIGLRRPNDQIRFLNAAQSGYTTNHGLETVYTQILTQQPEWVSIMFGANDCKLFGGPQAKTLVSLDEYRANIAEMTQAFLAHTSARPVLLTPAPVVEDVVNNTPEFQEMRMTWSNSDIEARAEAVRNLARHHGLVCVDLIEVFGDKPEADLYLDGLHPGPPGHRLILHSLLKAVVEGLG